MARDEQRIVLTGDTDFGALLLSPDRSHRRSSCSEAATTAPQSNRRGPLEHLDDLAGDLTTGAVALISDERIRVRRLPLLHNE